MTPFKQATGSDQERFVLRLLAFIAMSVNPLIIVGLEVRGIPIIKRNFLAGRELVGKKVTWFYMLRIHAHYFLGHQMVGKNSVIDHIVSQKD